MAVVSQNHKKLSCPREAARCFFISLNILPRHSMSLKLGNCKWHHSIDRIYEFLFAFHSNYGPRMDPQWRLQTYHCLGQKPHKTPSLEACVPVFFVRRVHQRASNFCWSSVDGVISPPKNSPVSLINQISFTSSPSAGQETQSSSVRRQSYMQHQAATTTYQHPPEDRPPIFYQSCRSSWSSSAIQRHQRVAPLSLMFHVY